MGKLSREERIKIWKRDSRLILGMAALFLWVSVSSFFTSIHKLDTVKTGEIVLAKVTEIEKKSGYRLSVFDSVIIHFMYDENDLHNEDQIRIYFHTIEENAIGKLIILKRSRSGLFVIPETSPYIGELFLNLLGIILFLSPFFYHFLFYKKYIGNQVKTCD